MARVYQTGFGFIEPEQEENVTTKAREHWERWHKSRTCTLESCPTCDGLYLLWLEEEWATREGAVNELRLATDELKELKGKNVDLVNTLVERNQRIVDLNGEVSMLKRRIESTSVTQAVEWSSAGDKITKLQAQVNGWRRRAEQAENGLRVGNAEIDELRLKLERAEQCIRMIDMALDTAWPTKPGEAR